MIVRSSFAGSLKDLPHFCRPHSGQRQQHHRQGDSSSPSDHSAKKFQIAKNLGGPIVHCAIKDCIHIQDGSCPLHRKTQNSKCFEPYGIDRFSTCRAVHPDFPGTILQFHDRASVHRKTADQMLEGIVRIRDQLSEEEFKKYFQVILTDRGSEFTKADEIEKLGCRLFYCDPMQSGQKERSKRTIPFFDTSALKRRIWQNWD